MTTDNRWWRGELPSQQLTNAAFVKRQQVWSRGAVVPYADPAAWRRDDYGNLMYWDAYGNRDSSVGWEFDHVFPTDIGGPDTIENLRPLHWQNNAQRGAPKLSDVLRGW